MFFMVIFTGEEIFNSGQSASIAAFKKKMPTAFTDPVGPAPDSVGTDGFQSAKVLPKIKQMLIPLFLYRQIMCQKLQLSKNNDFI